MLAEEKLLFLSYIQIAILTELHLLCNACKETEKPWFQEDFNASFNFERHFLFLPNGTRS